MCARGAWRIIPALPTPPQELPMFEFLIVAAAGMLIPSISLSVADRKRPS
jgi:hypothetical protein